MDETKNNHGELYLSVNPDSEFDNFFNSEELVFFDNPEDTLFEKALPTPMNEPDSAVRISLKLAVQTCGVLIIFCPPSLVSSED